MLSKAKVNVYEQHKEDLKNLKYFIRYPKEEVKEIDGNTNLQTESWTERSYFSVYTKKEGVFSYHF